MDQKYDEAEMVINGYDDPEGYKDEHFISFIYEIDNRKKWTGRKVLGKSESGSSIQSKTDRH